MRTIYLLVLPFVLTIAAATSVFATPPSCDVAQKMLSAAAATRGLRPKAEVPCVVATRDDIQRFLVETIKTKLPPEKVRMEEMVYKAVGVIPETFDYEKGIVALYVNQIGGYYDPEKKRFVMADWIPEAIQSEVAVHELTHALQDQHYNLEKMLDPKQENGDTLLAYSALVEGDAMLVMTDRVRAGSGKRSLVEESSIEDLVQQQLQVVAPEAKDSATPLPEALRRMLLFPYVEGLRFSHTLLRKGGGYQGIDASFRDPPQSTRDVLHPEMYLNPNAPKVEIPSIEALEPEYRDAKVIYSDTMGEFLIQAMLCSVPSEHGSCHAAAQGWVGDRVVIFEGEGARREVVWLTKWETSRDSQEFISGYKKLIEERYRAPFDTNGAAHLRPGKVMKIQVLGATVRVSVESVR